MSSRLRTSTAAGAIILGMICLGPVAADAPFAVAEPSAASTAGQSSLGSPAPVQVDDARQPVAATTGTFQLDVISASGALIATSAVDPMSPPPGMIVEPPSYERSVWIEQGAAPASPADGTTYVYGHACQRHVCPFTSLLSASIGDLIGDFVVVTTPAGVLEYQIAERGHSDKASNRLPEFAMDPTIPNRIVLVTCTFEADGSSLQNLVFSATLVRATPA